MNVRAKPHLMQVDTGQNALAECFSVDREYGLGDTTLNEDSILDNLDLPPPDVPLGFATDSSDTPAHEGQYSIHPLKSDIQPSGIQAEIDRRHDCTPPRSNSDHVIFSMTSEEAPLPERVFIPAGKPASLMNIDDADAPTTVYPQEPAFSETPSHDKRELHPDDQLDSVHIEPDCCQSPGAARPVDEEETREGLGYPYVDSHSSLPPTSSPPLLFSSSPYASSQSSVDDVSVGDAETPKTVLAAEAKGCASSHDYAHDGQVSVFGDPRSYDTVKAAISLATDEYHSQMGPTSYIEDDLQLLGKRSAYPDDLRGSQPVKRPKLDHRLYLPPAPKRATLASQRHQFRKLATPFRPPLKLPITTSGLTQTMNSENVQSIISTLPGANHDKIGPKGSTIPLQHKASNTPRPVTQFKSPLVNRVFPVDSYAIRLTPALQTLERKLQLLKRALKVKEDNEEEILAKLAGRWIEAGREVAYDVWDAIKDVGDFAGKATFTRRSRGWESTDGNIPWGWDTRPSNTGDEPCEIGPSEAPCTTGRLAPEEDDNDGCNTLGTMLRQLGIAPEVFGWDDDKEIFSD